MSKIKTISARTGKKGTPISASSQLFSKKQNEPLLAQVLHVQSSLSHKGLVTKKTRSEVSRTKSKWYRQKGTGRARHGAKTPSLFVGGGLVHGPDGKKRVLTLPKKLSQKALSQVLTNKLKNDKLFAITNLSSLKKTVQAASLLKKISPQSSFLVALSPKNAAAKKYFANIPNVSCTFFSSLNARQVTLKNILLIDSEALSFKKPEK
jgi:large subunit ribosomal protein L4